MKHPKVKNSIDNDLLMLHLVEKSMRKLTKVIKEKRKILEKKYKDFASAENSYNTSLLELEQWQKKQLEYVEKIKLRRNASKESQII